MIIGIGCDVINIQRVERIITRYKNSFLRRIFTPREIDLSKVTSFAAYYAKRFSAKESYAKATGHGIGQKVTFRDIEILNDINGAPYFSKHPLQSKNIKVFLSISDEKKYAISYVILQRVSVIDRN